MFKLGDSCGRVWIPVVDKLAELTNEHPGMIEIVKRELDCFLFRPNTHPRLIKAGTVLLTSIRLNRASKEVAKSFIDTYFQIFEMQVAVINEKEKKKGKTKKELKKMKKKKLQKSKEVESFGIQLRILSLVLMGLGNALPLSIDKNSSMDPAIFQRVDVLFKIVHSDNWNVSIQALALIFQVVAACQTLESSLVDSTERCMTELSA